MPEDQVDVYFGNGYLARSDVEFQKLAVQGLTIIIACGDSGAGDLGSPPEESNCSTQLHADWPSQSPYITALGTTFTTPNAQPICQLPIQQGGINCDHNPIGEVTTSLDLGFGWTTGGGFSALNSRPDFQSSFVQNYFTRYASNLPPASFYNANGRGYPDFAAVGHNIMVAQQGSFIPVDGTSCSAPIFAGVVTLLNDIRLQNGQNPLGYLNPLFYEIAASTPNAFRDVVMGHNKCGVEDFQPACCPYGFEASVGWDPVSGLGSPNYEVLAQQVVQYPKIK